MTFIGAGRWIVYCLMVGLRGAAYGQTVAESTQSPLPDVSALMHEVEAKQRSSEMLQKDYLYRESVQMDDLDKGGAVKKTQTSVFDVFWLQGVRVRRLLKKDGKELSPDERRKEEERIDKEVAKARERRTKGDEAGKETDSHGNEEITVSRLLELGSFTNERRTLVNGRSTILVDFTGNPKAKTHNAGENAVHEMEGTISVDEADRTIEHLEGRFVNNFKVGGGLVVNVKKDTSFALTNVKINDEVWLPQTLSGQGEARALLLFSVNGRLTIGDADYRRFKASSTILPGLSVVPDAAAPNQ